MSTQKKTTMGELILSLRKEQGMTQADLAEKMNVTDKAVSKWERNLSCSDINTLPRLAEIFGISVDELMQVKNAESGSTPEKSVDEIIDLVLKAVTVAMGVAVLVLSLLGKIDDMGTGFSLLGIGLTCAGISLLRGAK